MINIQKKRIKTKTVLIIIAGVVILGVAVAFLYYRFFSSSPTTSPNPTLYDSTTFNSNSDVPKATNSPADNSVASTKDTSNSTSVPNSDPNGPAPTAPSGPFMSSYSVTMTGDRSQVNSICTTTPGAKCSIHFAQGSVTKQLPDQTTDATGHTSWDWTTSDPTIGLSEGTWNISAVATFNGKTTTTNYPTPLQVTS